jgi:hypothetical protein
MYVHVYVINSKERTAVLSQQGRFSLTKIKATKVKATKVERAVR